MANKRKEQAEATEKKLKDTAHQLLNEKGYDGFTISDITKACGVSVGTFYNYFTSKEQLQGWLLYEPYLNLDNSLESDMRPIKECIESYMIAWIDYFSTYTPSYAASWLGRTNDDNLLMLKDREDPYSSEYDVATARTRKITARLNKAIESGELRKDTPTKSIALSIGSRLYGLCVWHSLSNGDIDIKKGVRTEAQLIGILLDMYSVKKE